MKLVSWSGPAAAVGCLGAALPRMLVFMPAGDWREQGPVGPVITSMILAAAAIALALGSFKPAGSVIAALAGLALLLKPALWPIHHDRGPHSFTSETHLYYVVPGLLLSLLAIALLAMPAARSFRRPHALGVVACASLASFLALVSFFAGRGTPFDLAASLLPGLALALVAIVLLARGVVAAGDGTASFVSPHAPTALASSYATDPAMQSLLRAVAHAPAYGAPRGQRFGHFEVVELLGSGGMGRVYRTRDLRLLRDVALKLLPPHAMHDPARRARMMREAQAVARINHPNVAALYDVAVEGEVPFLVMELVSGVTLRELLRAGPLPPPRARSIALQIVDGLAAAHQNAVVHRDLKPDNVMVTADGLVKILDFGLARVSAGEVSGPADAAPYATQHGQIMGTPAYMSPEQARGEPAGPRSDVFSFGGMLLEMLTGAAPFARAGVDETRRAVLEAPLPSALFDRLPPPLSSVISRCLARDPEARFADASELGASLRLAWQQ